MTVSDLKLKIFRQIDTLEEDKLEELSGILLNYIHGNHDAADWDRLSELQKTGNFEAIQEIEAGEGIPNHVVQEKIQSKYVLF